MKVEDVYNSPEVLQRSLEIAANRFYELFILEPDFELLLIGYSRYWATRKAWIEEKVAEWVTEAMSERTDITDD